MRISADTAHNRWHPDLEPVATVRPGEEITLETRDGLDGQLTRDSSHADVLTLDLGLGHPLTGPVYVEGAKPGDVVDVELLAYETGDFGVTPVIPGFGFLADVFTDPYLVTWELADGKARSPELPGVVVTGDPFAGVIGVAPSHELLEEIARRERALAEAGAPVADPLPETAIPAAARGGIRTIPPREIGGNLDIRQLVAGSRITLPVHAEGALVSVGDLHFAQGDGEVCGTGVEVAGAVTMRVFVRTPERPPRLPTFETPSRPAAPVLCDHRHRPRRADGRRRGGARRPARDDRPPRGKARRSTSGGVRPLLSRRRPPDLGGCGRALPARVGAASARRIRGAQPLIGTA